MVFTGLEIVVLVGCYFAVGALLALLWAIREPDAEIGLMIIVWPGVLVAGFFIQLAEWIEDLAWEIRDRW